jgi:hypothetical protein
MWTPETFQSTSQKHSYGAADSEKEGHGAIHFCNQPYPLPTTEPMAEIAETRMELSEKGGEGKRRGDTMREDGRKRPAGATVAPLGVLLPRQQRPHGLHQRGRVSPGGQDLMHCPGLGLAHVQTASGGCYPQSPFGTCPSPCQSLLQAFITVFLAAKSLQRHPLTDIPGKPKLLLQSYANGAKPEPKSSTSQHEHLVTWEQPGEPLGYGRWGRGSTRERVQSMLSRSCSNVRKRDVPSEQRFHHFNPGHLPSWDNHFCHYGT